MKNTYRIFVLKISKAKLDDLGVKKKILLKWISEKQGVTI
jgi:hypothetical protein